MGGGGKEGGVVNRGGRKGAWIPPPGGGAGARPADDAADEDGPAERALALLPGGRTAGGLSRLAEDETVMADEDGAGDGRPDGARAAVEEEEEEDGARLAAKGSREVGFWVKSECWADEGGGGRLRVARGLGGRVS